MILGLVLAGMSFGLISPSRQEHLTAAQAPTLADKAKLFWRRVFLSRGEMFATYPASRNSRYLWFYYARRVGHAIRSYTTHTVRRARLMKSRGGDPNAALVNWLKED